LKLKIVVTIPAIWNYKVQELIRKATQIAGLYSCNIIELELIGEPKAAMLAIFNKMST
jgi:molecular chaperone DnaK (HSP70)